MPKKWFMLLSLLSLLGARVHAAFGILPDGHLDMKALRKAYVESEFDQVRNALEGYMKAHPKDATRDEQVFSHIYLGVIYAAEPSGDVKAENHFNALLTVAPNVELVDMFVPPKIQNMFDRVKTDYLRAQEYERKYDALGNPLPEPGSGEASAADARKKPAEKTARVRSSGNNHWAWWTLGAVAVAGAGAGAYYLSTASHSSGSNRVIPGP